MPKAGAEFVAAMEDVLEVYQRPYDPLRPVVCIDETNKQLIKETRVPCEPEPLAGRRETVVTETRTAEDFAKILKYTTASLYKTFQPEEARRLEERFEWHYTPKHGSWLDMAEIEIGIMSRQALAKPLADMNSFKEQVRIWTIKRNIRLFSVAYTSIRKFSWLKCWCK